MGQGVYPFTACPDTHLGKWDNLGLLESRGGVCTCYWLDCYYLASWTLFQSMYSFIWLTPKSMLVLHKLECNSLAVGSLEAGWYTEVGTELCLLSCMWLSNYLSATPSCTGWHGGCGIIPALRSSESARASGANISGFPWPLPVCLAEPHSSGELCKAMSSPTSLNCSHSLIAPEQDRHLEAFNTVRFLMRRLEGWGDQTLWEKTVK